MCGAPGTAHSAGPPPYEFVGLDSVSHWIPETAPPEPPNSSRPPTRCVVVMDAESVAGPTADALVPMTSFQRFDAGAFVAVPGDEVVRTSVSPHPLDLHPLPQARHDDGAL